MYRGGDQLSGDKLVPFIAALRTASPAEPPPTGPRQAQDMRTTQTCESGSAPRRLSQAPLASAFSLAGAFFAGSVLAGSFFTGSFLAGSFLTGAL